MTATVERDGFLARHVPITTWARRYRWGQWLTLDLIAGVSVAALLIPESMGYAGVAGLPPEVGLYAAPLALVGYAIFGRSTVLVVAASSSTAAVSASVVAGIDGSNDSMVALSAALALFTGLIFVAAGLARLGWVANFMSKTGSRASSSVSRSASSSVSSTICWGSRSRATTPLRSSGMCSARSATGTSRW